MIILTLFLAVLIQEGQYSTTANGIYLCDRGSVKIDGSCFTFGSRKNWEEANRICRSKNAHLARIDNKGKHNALNGYMSEVFPVSELFWVDLKKYTSGFKHSSNSMPLRESFWNPGQPSTNTKHECVAKCNFGWTTFDCRWRGSFICEHEECPSGCKQDANIPESLAFDWGKCSDGVVRIENTCYFINSSSSVTWKVASAECVRKSGKLARLGKSDKYKLLDQYLKVQPHFSWVVYWVAGRRDRQRNAFYDGKEKITETRWSTGEPNNFAGKEDCIEYKYQPHLSQYQWNDAHCKGLNQYICELRECPTDCNEDKAVTEGPAESETNTKRESDPIKKTNNTNNEVSAVKITDTPEKNDDGDAKENQDPTTMNFSTIRYTKGIVESEANTKREPEPNTKIDNKGNEISAVKTTNTPEKNDDGDAKESQGPATLNLSTLRNNTTQSVGSSFQARISALVLGSMMCSVTIMIL